MLDSIVNVKFRRTPPEGHLRTDAIVALLLALTGCFTAWLTHAAEMTVFESPLWQQCLGSFLVAAPLVLRRRFPIAMMLLQTALYNAASFWTGMDLYASQVMLFLGFYSVGAWAWHRNHALVSRIVAVVAMLIAYIVGVLLGTQEALGDAAFASATSLTATFVLFATLNVAFFVGAWIFGDRAWTQAVERHQLEQATEEIKALQQELVESAVESERMRIARELHDVVAHHVTAMSIQSAAARRLLTSDPERAEASLKQVETSARDAVADLRTMVMTLRANESDDAAPPTLDDLEGLVGIATENGLNVALERIGQAPAVSPVVELALYRVAQEALTNARKHAGPGAEVAVRLRNSDDLLELEVSDDGRATPATVPGSGAGLVGMRERMSAVGGTLQAGPKPRGGFLVRAAVPTGVSR